jgi:hypothetical protein|uniref:Uncharacterized protein n=1 Tax=Siphoviridae sp. ct7aK2 TaxID=2825351 RepID=A0A8S5U9C6_9CAUD|nr:MAG TPA: hypothetical protein [Siphoviridae sp. ct7aK2]
MELLEIISKIHEAKRNKQISPDHVMEIELINEVFRSVKIELSHLVKDGTISEVRTLNDKAYIINNI